MENVPVKKIIFVGDHQTFEHIFMGYLALLNKDSDCGSDPLFRIKFGSGSKKTGFLALSAFYLFVWFSVCLFPPWNPLICIIISFLIFVLLFPLPTRASICRPFKETRNRFPAWRTGTTTLFTYRPARLHRLAEWIPGLHKRLQTRALQSRFSSVFLGRL